MGAAVDNESQDEIVVDIGPPADLSLNVLSCNVEALEEESFAHFAQGALESPPWLQVGTLGEHDRRCFPRTLLRAPGIWKRRESKGPVSTGTGTDASSKRFSGGAGAIGQLEIVERLPNAVIPAFRATAKRPSDGDGWRVDVLQLEIAGRRSSS